MGVTVMRKWLAGLVVLVSLFAANAAAAQWWEHRRPVHLWDTGSPLAGQADLSSRDGWRAVTVADSRRLQGDLVVQADGVAAAFASRLGKVLVYGGAASPQGVAAVGPAELAGKQATIALVTVAEQNGVVMVEATFRGPGADRLPIAFWFTGNHAVAIRPEGNTRGLSISAPIDVALVPSIVGDDLIYDPRDYPAAKALSVPSEHMLLGLLKGEGSVLVTTWQEAMPTVRLEIAGEPRGISAVTFVGGQDVCLAMLDAPGIWHREVLGPRFLERDVALGWKPPYPAIWLTQLYEDELKTTFEFWDERGEHWRGGIGSYVFPTWFSDGKAMLSLSKQIVPEGEAIIYHLERNGETPDQVDTPIDIARRTLAGDVRIDLLDVEGRPTWWPMRPDAVLGGETCDVTDILKGIFEAGQEVEKQAIVRGGVEDMCFHLEVMFERDGRFYPFAKDMLAYLDAQAKAKPELAPYLHDLRRIAEQMVVIYDNARDTMGSMDHAHELGAKTIALAKEKRPDNPERFMELKQGWCGMGGTVEELSRRENTLVRKLHQQAAYLAAGNPDAIPIAEEIRRRAKQCLRRPDSYEVWEQN
jgi:hypothetical protein